MRTRRWDPCVDHRGQETVRFFREYFAAPHRSCCLVAGAGFDPRSTITTEILAAALGDRLSAVFLREERPTPSPKTIASAARNVEVLRRLVPSAVFESIEVFAPDNAVVVGRNAVEKMRGHSYQSATDLVVDMSALSIGTSFPVVRYLLEYVESRLPEVVNLHVVVASLPEMDERRRRVSNDVPSLVHSFHGTLRLHSNAGNAKLWMPQLSIPKRDALDRIFASESFHDVCPILPFPSRNPRTADVIIEHFLDQLERSWGVDSRNFVYASEEDPLDVYRTILEIDEQRRPVFERLGSVVVLSPVGSKAVALGSLMAAIERSLPVVYVEALEYALAPKETMAAQEAEVLHVWIHGEAYPQARPEVVT
jgi:hypothetical protein